LPEDDPAYQHTFITACQQAGIEAQPLTPAEALRIEPAVNPALLGAVQVPDGTVDPFRLTAANMLDAREHGAAILTGCEVTGLLRQGDRVHGVTIYNHQLRESRTLRAQVVVNAAGIWGQRIAEYADLRIAMFPAKGSLLILDHRINRQVINRCRKPADADILVPGDTISLIGTTSMHIPYDEIDDNRVTPGKSIRCCAKGKSWRRSWGGPGYCAPTPAYVRWSPAMTIPADAASAAASCCSTTPGATAWKALSPSPAVS
jgi:glycerol-3-phosphate dehydrogenase